MDAPAARHGTTDAVLTDGFIWALASLCRLHRVPFDPELVLKQFPPPYDLAMLLRAAQACGLKAGLAGAKAEGLAVLPLPCGPRGAALSGRRQETLLFSGTVYDNLAMANPHASFEDIVTACKAAEIHATLERLPQGYQTPLGEHGVGLSGGQKQRLAIARALLKRPKILIFDEATSNLDAQTAEALAATVNTLKGRATVLFIAHQVPPGLQVDHALRFGAP